MPVTLTGESRNLALLLSSPDTRIIARLAKNSLDVQDETAILTDLVECDFAGYAPVPLTTFDFFQVEDELCGEALSAPIEFVAGPLDTPQLAGCLYVTIAKGNDDPRLWQLFIFDADFAFDAPGRTLRRQLRIYSYDDTVSPP